MPSISKRDFKHIQVKELHPTFAAEIEGVDFENISDDVFADILAASAKVSKDIPTTPLPQETYSFGH